MALRFLPNRTLGGDTLADALRSRDAGRLRRYREYLDFYEGKHWVSAAGRRNGRLSLTLNYGRAIVDKGISYLLGRGLNFAVPEASGLEAATAAAAEQVLYRVYDDGDVDAVDLAVAFDSAVLGDGVYKVVWEAASQRVRVVSVDPLGWFPRWTGDDLGTLWRADLAYRLEGSEAERLYPSTDDGRRTAGEVEVVERWTAETFELSVGGRDVRGGANPYGFVPFVHVPNLPAANENWGVSDLRDVIGINRALNERLSDEADTIRYHADPPVIFKGVSEHTDLAVRSTQRRSRLGDVWPGRAGPGLALHACSMDACC